MNIKTTFFGHIDENKRPENFPKVVSCSIELYNTEPGFFRELTNNMATAICKQGAMVVSKDDRDMKIVVGNDPLLANFDRNFLVPLHMITHITMITEMLPDPPDPEKEAEKVTIVQ
jgi:hypothetical protein